MASPQEPLWELRPPKMDMMTYLTYVEQNISKEKLPVLLEVLQNDTDLADAIGWDLVNTLLPLLPESEACLLAVAKLGNPKEVVLKVSECLRSIDFDFEDDVENHTSPKDEQPPPLPLPVQQFQVLLYMLAILHPRIIAKFPSRFLSSSLQAILGTYSEISSHYDEITCEMVKFVKTISGPKRPHFPPRRPSSALALATLMSKQGSEPAETDVLTSEEDKIQTRLLQSFITHILDEYMQSLPPVDGVSGLAWCSRYMEHIKHPMVMTKTISLTEQFSHSPELEGRLTTVGQIVALAQDLEIHSDELLSNILDPKPETEGDRSAEESHPTSAAEIPLSKAGALHLYTARKAMEVLYDGPTMNTLPIFPDHAKLIQNFADQDGPESLAMGSDTVVDALLFHGLVALQSNQFGDLESDIDFNKYLQITSILSSCLPSPTLRFQAYYLTSTVLRSHPRELTQIEFINDTLEHCPFENLKTSAVSWIKGLTLDAVNRGEPEDSTPSLFATPAPLSMLCPFIFPDLTSEYLDMHSSEDEEVLFEEFRLNYSFYAASVNFIYLLIQSKQLHEPLQVQKVLSDGDVATDFVKPIQKALSHFLSSLKEGGSLHDAAKEDNGIVPQLEVLRMSCDGVFVEAKKLGWWES
jgi:Uncharacterised protein family, YAP/Alf4/glomulin